MFLNILGWLILLGITIFFGWLTLRAWQAKRTWVKWLGVILGGILTLILLLLSGLTTRGLYITYVPPPFNPPLDLKVAGSPEQVARGEHLAHSVCGACHSITGDLPLDGGYDVGADSPVPIGAIIASNLTPGGPLKNWSDGEIFRAVRQGVDREGNRLIAMSTIPIRNLSDEDIQAVIAYLRIQPAKPALPKQGDYPNLLFIIFVGANLAPTPPPLITGSISAPAKAPSADYGKYVLSYNNCSLCHGEDYSGGTPGSLSGEGPSLRVVKGWSRAEFITTLRTGIDPSGHQIDRNQMAWEIYRFMDDDELGGMYEYLYRLP